MTEGKAPMKPYSVLLLYPDWVNESGTDTYYTFVEAADPCAAIAERSGRRWRLTSGPTSPRPTSPRCS